MPSQLPAPLTETLTPKMLAFIEAYVDSGGRNQRRAALLAGYSKTSADTVASRLLRRPDVLAVLRHIVETRIRADAVASAETLRELRDSPSTPANVRRLAASELLDRAGLLVERFSTVHHVVEDRRTVGQIGSSVYRAMQEMASDIGVEIVVRDPEKLERFLTSSDEQPQAVAAEDVEWEEIEDLLG